MQTAVDFIKEELDKLGLLDKGQVMTNIFEKAKKIEHNQRGYTKENVLKAGEIDEINHHDYKHIVKLLDEAREINETYGSKGSDETNVNNVEKLPNVLDDAFNQELFNYFSQEFNINLLGTEMHDIIDIVKKTTSSKTEISDENAYTNGYLHGYNAAIAELPKEISDEDIEEAYHYFENVTIFESHNRESIWKKAIRWYREQLKKK